MNCIWFISFRFVSYRFEWNSILSHCRNLPCIYDILVGFDTRSKRIEVIGMWVKIWIYLNRNPINSFDHSAKFELHWFMLYIIFSVEFPPPQRRCAENTHWNPYFIFNDDSQYFLVNAKKIECVFPFTPFVITSCRWIQTMDSMYNEITNRLRKKNVDESSWVWYIIWNFWSISFKNQLICLAVQHSKGDYSKY